MKLLSAYRAPNPRRVLMFIAEKGIAGIEVANVDLGKLEHLAPDFRAKSPFAKVPALELDDGRVLTESRAICTYLEGLHPEPNLMGRDATERAFIEMVDRDAELYLFIGLAMWIRHCHPGLAPLENPQFPDYGRAQGEKAQGIARWFDERLAVQEWIAGDRMTIADITTFCALEFARGLMKYNVGEAGLVRLQAWRDRMAARPSASVT